VSRMLSSVALVLVLVLAGTTVVARRLLRLWAGFVDEVDRRFGGPPPSTPALSDDDVADGLFTGVVTQGIGSLLGQRGG
jgi:hypothetical protein